MAQYQKFFIWFLIFSSIGLFFYNVSAILFPFITSMILAYFLNPIVEKLGKISLQRSTSSFIVVALFCTTVITLSVLLLPKLMAQIKSFATNVPEYKKFIIEEVLPYLTKIISKFDPNLVEKIENSIHELTGSIFMYILGMLNNIWQSGLALINILSLIFITPIVTFYLLRDWDILLKKIDSLIPINGKTKIKQQISLIDKTLSGYIRGQINVCLILGIYYGIALSIMDLNFGLFIGLLTGILTLIPYLGFIIGASVAIIVAIIQFQDLQSVITVMSILIIGQIIEGNFITPKLIGEKIGLHPVWMFFSMLSGGVLFGFVGVLFAIPVAAIIGIIIRFLVKIYLSSSLYNN